MEGRGGFRKATLPKYDFIANFVKTSEIGFYKWTEYLSTMQDVLPVRIS
jgi:hypothetical protein